MKLAYLVARYGTAFPANEIHVQLCQALSELGAEVTVVAFSVEGETGGLPTVRLRPAGHLLGPLARALAGQVTGYPYLFGLASALAKAVAASAFDAIHVEGAFPAGGVLWLARRDRQLPYAVSLQGTDVIRRPDLGLDRLERPAVRWLAYKALQAATIVRANSPLTADLVSKLAPDTKVQVVPRNIAARYLTWSPPQLADLRDRARRVLRDRLSVGSEPVVMAFGRMHPCKGFEQLLEASAQLQTEGVVHRLIVAGPDSPDVNRRGSYRRSLAGLAQRLRFTLPPLFLDAVDEEDMPAFYAAADVVAVPSLIEGFNKVAVEAAALARPVIISDGAGAHTYFAEHGAGLVVQAGNVTSLAEGLASLLMDRSMADELAAKAYAMARMFSPQRVAEQLLQLFHQ